jgi:methionine-rich copper-binding protein CopC
MTSVKYGKIIVALWLGFQLCSSIAVWAEERDEFIVNDDGSSFAQSSPRIAASSGCGFVVVWVDKRNGVNDIYFQRYDADGYPVGGNTKANDDSTYAYQNEPAIASSLTGLYSIVWRDYRDGAYPFGPDIFLQPFDSSLSTIGTNTNVSAAGPDSLKESPDIAVMTSGAGLVVWADYRNRHWDIYGQRFAADGSLVGGNFKINDDAGTDQQHAPRVALSPLGWYVVTWYDNRLGNDDVYVQRLDTTGTLLGINVKVNTDAQDYRQCFPDVCVDPLGDFSIVWIDYRGGTYPSNPDVYLRRYDSLGTPVTAETKLNNDATQNAQRDPSVAADRMGKVATVWSDSTSTSWDITGQMIDGLGNLSGSNLCFSTTTDSNQIDPDIALDGQYRYVTWADNRNGNWDVFASIVRYHQPPLAISPASLSNVMLLAGTLPDSQLVIVNHTGASSRDFTVASSVDWLTVAPSTSTTDDTVSVEVNTDTLGAGTYIGVLTFIDTPTQDSNVFMAVRLDVLDLPDDTITVVDGIVEEDAAGSTPIIATITNEATFVSLPLQYDTSCVTVDSAVAGPTLPGEISFSATVDQTGGLISLQWETDSVFTPGAYYLADLHFTAGGYDTVTTINSVTNDTLSLRVEAEGLTLVPIFFSGDITISNPTAVEDEQHQELPMHFELTQNWPNPFNATTLITYSLPTQSKVTLEVYNVLGQQVRLLQDGSLAAGNYTVSWDGCLTDGRPAPSGVYFYRLSSEAASFVKKMVLLK